MHVTALTEIIDRLNRAGVEYLVVGGVAVIARGYTRTTQDLDLVIALNPSNVARAAGVLEALGYRPALPVKLSDFADPAKRTEWIERRNMVVFQLVTDNKGWPAIDIFPREPFDVTTELQRAARIEIAEGVELPIPSLPTLIAMKQGAGRHLDLADVEELKKILEKLPDGQ